MFLCNNLCTMTKMFSCDFCQYTSNKSFNMTRHIKRNHSQMKLVNHPLSRKDSLMSHINTIHNGEQIIPKTKYDLNVETFKNNESNGIYDIRLKENFKIFISGPSRCGKTVFVSKLLENIHTFAKLPPRYDI